jgi:hypothetical protein
MEFVTLEWSTLEPTTLRSSRRGFNHRLGLTGSLSYGNLHCYSRLKGHLSGS